MSINYANNKIKQKGHEMSLTKTDGMAYEVTGSKKVNGKRVAIKTAEQLSSPRLLLILLNRHKVALLAIGNIILVLNYILPFWPQLVLGLIGK